MVINLELINNTNNFTKLTSKIMKKIGLILSAVIILSATSYAQKFKYGHMNGEAIFQKMDKVKVADAQLKTFVAALEEQAKSMQEEYTKKVTDYKAKEATLSESVKTAQVGQINNLNESIQQFQISAQEDVNKKRNELYAPIVTEFNAALKSVAKKNGYKFIIDNSKGVLLYFDETDDVSKLVEAELGIKE